MSIPPSIVDPNRILMTGENPFVRLATEDNDNYTTSVSFWRMTFCPAGPGHVLFAKSELTDDQWRIYSDNVAMTRWLQNTVQGMLNSELADTSMPVIDAEFSKEGDPKYYWTERIMTSEEDLSLTWYDIGEPLLIHTQPNQAPDRPYGVCTVLIPAMGTRLVRDGVQAKGSAWSRDREGHPFSTCALAFSESWTEAK